MFECACRGGLGGEHVSFGLFVEKKWQWMHAEKSGERKMCKIENEFLFVILGVWEPDVWVCMPRRCRGRGCSARAFCWKKVAVNVWIKLIKKCLIIFSVWAGLYADARPSRRSYRASHREELKKGGWSKKEEEEEVKKRRMIKKVSCTTSCQ